jgi:hypothetical protein
MSEGPATRRWFAFSLRALFFAITAIALLVSYAKWSLNWIDQRKAFLAEKQAVWDRFAGTPPGMFVRCNPTAPPLPLRLFGETGAGGLQFYVELDTKDDTIRHETWEREHKRAMRLFPEARWVNVLWHPWPIRPD